MPDTLRKRLDAIAGVLPDEQLRVLLEFAEFLEERYALPQEVPEPVNIPRPEKENVVKAIKRLSASYPMLSADKLFNETSALMMQHLLKGQPAHEVIDELEALFQRHYDQLLQRSQADQD